MARQNPLASPVGLRIVPPAKPRPWFVAGLGVFAVAALGVAGYALSVYGVRMFGGEGLAGPDLRTAERWPRLLALHASTGAVALLAGTAQVLATGRGLPAVWHRRVGLVYVVAVAVSGAVGLLLSPWAAGGTMGQWGFAALAVGWLTTTALGACRIRWGDRAGHRQAMVRSFAFTCAAITLRLQLPLALAIGFDFAQAYPWIAWTCWVPNLIFAEVWLRRR